MTYKDLTRAERLNELKELYLQRAYSDAELAKRFGVDRATIYRDRITLERRYPFVEESPGRYRLDRVRLLSAVQLNAHEALRLYLAVKRLLRQTHFADKHTASAAEKIAARLSQPFTAHLVRATAALLDRETHPHRISVLEQVTVAWLEQRKVRLIYRALRAQRPLEHTVAVYFIEPALWSESAYIVGYSETAKDIIPFKLERIEDARLTSEHFELPADLDEDALLRNAWGIWLGEGSLVTVRLRFAPGLAARRVQESIWHPSQTITLLEDGGCEWSVQVTDWREMLPWVRGWGADVEVLEPPELREAIRAEVRRLAERYGVTASGVESDTLRRFFGG